MEIEQERLFSSPRTAFAMNHEYIMDGFFAMLIEGRQRRGKSSYVSQTMAAAYGKWELIRKDKKNVPVCVSQDYEVIKPFIVYPPKDFLHLVLHTNEKQRGACWDDAGFWLFALDWYEPFVKTVAKYIQLAGRQFGALMFTTPSRKLISQKILDAMPDILICRIDRLTELRESYFFRPRIAKVYETWDYPDGKKGGVRRKWRDRFNAMLPDEYYKWYKPISDGYMDIGKRILAREVGRMTKKMEGYELELQAEDVAKVTGGEEKIKELSELIKSLEGEKPQSG